MTTVDYTVSTEPFDPASLEDVVAFHLGETSEHMAASLAWRHVITLPSLIRPALDTTAEVRNFAHSLGWKRTLSWSRSPYSVPVDGLAQPHAAPDQMVAIYDWPVENDHEQDATDLHNSPETWGPNLARRLYIRNATDYSEAISRFTEDQTEGPVPMTFQWKRMSDPMAGFFD